MPATTLLPEQAKPSRSIMRMVLLVLRFFLVLARRGTCQKWLDRVCTPQVGGAIPPASSTNSADVSTALRVYSVAAGFTLQAIAMTVGPPSQQGVARYV